MPGPTTEILNDDLKQVRADMHQIELSLTAEIHTVDKAVGKLAAEFGVFKWLLGATLATALSGVVGSAYWAGSLASRVTALDARVDKLDGRLDRIESRMERIEGRMNSIDGRLERIESTITKAIGRADGGEVSTPAKR